MAYKDGTTIVKVGYSKDEIETLKRRAEAIDRPLAYYIRKMSMDGKINKKTK